MTMYKKIEKPILLAPGCNCTICVLEEQIYAYKVSDKYVGI